MAALANLPLTGASGVKYDFSVYSNDTTFKALGGVYAITRRYQKQDGSFTHDIIYIGQTNDLSERFDSHHQISCFNRHNWNCICIHLDDNKTSRLNKESDLIESKNPTCNQT